jgi:hypothetical protein
MRAFPIKSSSGQVIITLDDWLAYAPPTSRGRHWRDNYSAKELAQHWLAADALPADVAGLLQSSEATARFIAEAAFPEVTTRFDGDSRGPRNHDLVVVGSANGAATLLGIEGKGVETFDVLVAEKLATPEPTKLPARIDGLAQALFGTTRAEILDLRYQLLSAAAGTLAEAKARTCRQAILIVQEFLPPDQHAIAAQNMADLHRFVQRLGGGSRELELESGRLVGPLTVPGSDRIPRNVDLWIGKTTVPLSMTRKEADWLFAASRALVTPC